MYLRLRQLSPSVVGYSSMDFGSSSGSPEKAQGEFRLVIEAG